MDLNVIHAQLGSVLRAINQELTKLLPADSIPLAISTAHDRLYRNIGSWERQLDLLVRNLSAELQRLELESKRLASLPRDARYSARQSVSDRSRNLNDAMDEVIAVRERLERLLDRLGRPTGPEIVKALEKIGSGTYKQVETTRAVTRELRSLTTKQSGPVLRGATPSAGPDLMVSVAVICRLLQILALRLMDGSRRGADPPH